MTWGANDRRISYEDYKKIHASYTIEKGDILLTIVGSIGESAIVKRDMKNIAFQRSVAVLRPVNIVSSDFLYTEIQTCKFQRELENRKSTSAQPGIYLGDLEKIPIFFPNYEEEQERIGTLFQRIDKLITLHQRNL